MRIRTFPTQASRCLQLRELLLAHLRAQGFRAELRLHHASPPRQETTNDHHQGRNFTTTAPVTSSSMLSYQAKGINKFTFVNLRLLGSNRPGGIFLLAALLSTGSRTVTESYRAAPFQGWSVMHKPDAEGSALLTSPVTTQ
jgi:hypothetical protein